MADPIRLDFGLSSDPGRHGFDAGPMHWNCFIEPVKEGKHPTPLHAMDGLLLFANTGGNGVFRGMAEMAGEVYNVVGTNVGRVDTNGAYVSVGTLAGTTRVSMAKNSATTPQLVIVADGAASYIQSNVLASVSDGDLPSPIVGCCYLNRRILYAIDDGRVFFSAVDNATDIAALDVFTAEGNADDNVGIVTHMQEAWVFGEKTTEIFRDTGDAAAPFRRNEAGVIPKGCIGRDTIAALDLDLFWVGDDGVVYMARGYQVDAISTFAVSKAILDTTNKSNIEAMTYHYGGHAFYVLSGPDWSWAYNRTTSTLAGQHIWDPRLSYTLDRWRASGAIAFDNAVVLGDYNSNVLYKLSRSTFTENGNTLVLRARTAPMHAHPKQMCIDRLHLDFVTGVGLNSSDAHASNPQVGLRWSDDGGSTWSNQRLKTLGAIGARKTRVVFDGLGVTGRTGRIWEVEVSSPVIRCLMYSEIEGDLIGT